MRRNKRPGLNMVPEPEHVNNLLTRQIKRRHRRSGQLGLEHVQVKRNVVADDHIGPGDQG